MNELVAASAAPLTPFSEPWLSNLRRGLGRTGNHPMLMAGFTMTAEQRRTIERRRSILVKAITAGPDDRPLIGVELAKLLAGFANQDPGLLVALRIAAYADAFGNAPAWAVREARLRLMEGRVVLSDWNRSFAPSPVQFGEVVRDVLRSYRDDLADLTALAAVEPTLEPSAEEREHVGARMDELARALSGLRTDREATRRQAAENALRASAVALGLPSDTLDRIPDGQRGKA